MKGIHLVLSLGIRAIWIESDSLSDIKTINGDQPSDPTSGCYLSEIQKLLTNFESYCVTHSWREANKTADYISRMDVGLEDTIFWSTEFSGMLHDILSWMMHKAEFTLDNNIDSGFMIKRKISKQINSLADDIIRVLI
ncbi:hypothetical protein GQ457_09G010370 [Hibiscus cannabinus]